MLTQRSRRPQRQRRTFGAPGVPRRGRDFNLNLALRGHASRAPQCPLLALSGHPDGVQRCLLPGEKRTLICGAVMSDPDPTPSLWEATMREGGFGTGLRIAFWAAMSLALTANYPMLAQSQPGQASTVRDPAAASPYPVEEEEAASKPAPAPPAPPAPPATVHTVACSESF